MPPFLGLQRECELGGSEMIGMVLEMNLGLRCALVVFSQTPHFSERELGFLD